MVFRPGYRCRWTCSYWVITSVRQPADLYAPLTRCCAGPGVSWSSPRLDAVAEGL